MKLGAFMMPSHPPDRGIGAGIDYDLAQLRLLDELGFAEAWIGEHFTAPWEPCPAPDLLIAQALRDTKQIVLAPGAHLLPYHHPIELAHRVAYLDHMARGRYMLGVGISALPGDLMLYDMDAEGGENRRRTLESLDIMLRLWRDGGFDYDGEFCDPPCPAFNRYSELFVQAIQRRGADPFIGRKLVRLLRDAGFASVNSALLQPYGSSGDVKQVQFLTFLGIRDALIQSGLADAAEIAAIARELQVFAQSPRTTVGWPRIFQVWGRV